MNGFPGEVTPTTPAVEFVPLPSGEMLDIDRVADEDKDRVLDGYITTARVLGSVVAAELYKKANPASRLTAKWFESEILKPLP